MRVAGVRIRPEVQFKGHHFDKLVIAANELHKTVVPRIKWKDVTSEVTRVVANSGIREGIVAVQTLHTTAALLVNENEKGLVARDIPRLLEKICPVGSYAHDREERLRTLCNESANGVSHLRSIALSSGNPLVALVVSNHKIHLGTWQGILFYDLDPENRPCRTLVVQVVGMK